MEENRIPIFFGDDKRLVGYYPVEEPSAWPKADHRVNLCIGDTITVSKRQLMVTGITTKAIFAVSDPQTIVVVGSGIPLEEH